MSVESFLDGEIALEIRCFCKEENMQIKKFTDSHSLSELVRPIYIVIPAAGLGLRMGISDSKQFLKIQGIPVLAHTLLAFAKWKTEYNLKLHAVLVTNQENLERAKELVDEYQIDFVEKIVEGGATRQESVSAGIAALASLPRAPEANDQVFIHDGARCLIDQSTLSKLFLAGARYDVCVAATPCKNTIKAIVKPSVAENAAASGSINSDMTENAVTEAPIVDHTLERDTLYEVQTPQVFRYRVLLEVNEKAKEMGIVATDDTALAEACGIPVHLITCSYGNIKITTPEDVALAEFILSQQS